MATVGKNILDNLTTGMYSDSKVIFREYIQNACDQIDLATSIELLGKNEGCIDIFLDPAKRYISIRDNATGVKSSVFIEDVGDIANSNKRIGENKGFRGIGRLCGLAYCKVLTFTTSYKGEPIKSIMTCDAQKMRAMLAENKKYTLDEIWDAIVSYSTEKEAADKHYFEVEMFEINRENTDLLDDAKVREYLSFVAPVPYRNTFILRSQIYSHADSIGYKIDEYCVRVNGCQIFKDYTTNLKEISGNSTKTYDDIFRIECKDFRNDKGELIAWMWIGLSRFEKQIPKVNLMRGLRLRSANIQIGSDAALTGLFKEPRGNYYFVGEVFAVDSQLVPNSQRDYFNENESRVEFENALRVYFFDVLHKLYYEANRVKNDYRRQEEYIERVEEFSRKRETGFVDDEEQRRLQVELEKARSEAEEARKRLERTSTTDESSPITDVRTRIGTKFDATRLQKTVSETPPPPSSEGKKRTYVTDGMSKLSRNERKLVSKILTIINSVAPPDIATQIIEKIKEEMS